MSHILKQKELKQNNYKYVDCCKNCKHCRFTGAKTGPKCICVLYTTPINKIEVIETGICDNYRRN